MIYKEEFEEWFLGLDYDFREMNKLSIGTSGKYFFTTTQALYDQFCHIKNLEKALAEFIN